MKRQRVGSSTADQGRSKKPRRDEVTRSKEEEAPQSQVCALPRKPTKLEQAKTEQASLRAGNPALTFVIFRKVTDKGRNRFQVRNRSEFIADWCALAKQQEMHEVVQADTPTRLFVDIDLVKETLPTPEQKLEAVCQPIHKIAKALMSVFQLPAEEAMLCVVSQDCRELEGGKYKLSYHVTWPNIVFDSSHTHMKPFVLEALGQQREKDGVDTAVYERNHTMRIAFAIKWLGTGGHTTGLAPYDQDEGTELAFANEDAKAQWFEKTLIQGFSATGTRRMPYAVKIPRWEEGIRDIANAFSAEADELLVQGKELEEQFAALKGQFLDSLVCLLNSHLCIIRKTTGKPTTIEEIVERSASTGRTSTRFVLRSCDDCKTAFRKYSVSPSEVQMDKHGFPTHVKRAKKQTNPIDYWLSAHDQRECDRVDFDPNPNRRDDSKVFNLFRGLAITQETAVQNDEDTQIFCDHIMHIWCKDDAKLCNYLLDWMAHLVQRPWIKMIVCPLLKGGQGAGKGTIVQMLGAILGEDHFWSTQRLDDVLGTFQPEAIKTNLLTFLDECTFAGDKKQASILKGLMSESKRTWQAKFVNPILVNNCSNFIAASNYDRTVLVENDDRRYLTIEVDSKYAGPQTPESKVYFDRLAAVKPESVAFMLYNRDVSTFNPHAKPSTGYHRYQKSINFDSITAYIEKILQDGCLTCESTQGVEEKISLSTEPSILDRVVDRDRSVTVLKSQVVQSYRAFFHSGPKHHPLASDVQLFKTFYGVLGKAVLDQNKRVGGKGCQQGALVLKSLPRLREAFTDHMREPSWEWQDVDEGCA